MLYLMTFAIALLVALTLSPVRADTATGVVMLLAVVWVLGIFLYYRLLGRLAWACQGRLLEKADAEPPQTKKPEEVELTAGHRRITMPVPAK